MDDDGSVSRQGRTQRAEMRVLPGVEVELTDEARQQVVRVLANIMVQWWSCAASAASTRVPDRDG
jgi:hypothetical protein